MNREKQSAKREPALSRKPQNADCGTPTATHVACDRDLGFIFVVFVCDSFSWCALDVFTEKG